MFKIAIMGCGVVGSGVADILIDKKEELSKRFNDTVELKKILDLRDFTGTPYEPYATKDAEEIFSDPEIKLVVMTIGGLDFAYNLSKRALESGRHLVTSNKEVVAEYGRELTQAAFDNGVQFLYEASSGGGIPVIRPINICLSSNDIYEIQGILNGTTNYILTRMKDDDMSFEDALKLAQKNGYAEAEPSADVDGHDACRKIAILSSLAYDEYVDYKKVPCDGIRNVSYEDLLMAEKLGFSIKLIGGSKKTDKGITCSVEPLLLSKDHMLSGVSSVFNSIMVKGTYVGDVMFYGRGAGKLPTASAVMGDVIAILCGAEEKVMPGFMSKEAELVPAGNTPARYYVRVKSGDTSKADFDSCALAVFGNESMTAEQGEYASVITGYFTKEELNEKIAQLEKSVAVKCENIIKVEN